MVRVKNVLDSWKAIRQDTASAVEEFPVADFDFRPVPEVQSFREIARHILDAADGFMGLVVAGETDLSNPETRPRMKAHMRNLPADAAGDSLAAALRQSMEEIVAKLEAQPAEFFAGIVKRMDGQEVTRLELVQLLKEHELTHRQQLFVYLRLKGLTPATTRRRVAREAAK
jgi:uncharacterized damage-inducible protein DinB